MILCGGAINTPQLLQLSGVGDQGLLREQGVPLVHHLPGVGENLQDHLEVYIQYASTQPVSIAPGLRGGGRPKIAYEWLFHRRGPRRHQPLRGRRLRRGNDDVDYPNLMFHFLPVAIRYDGSAPTRATATRCTSGRCTPTPAAPCGSGRRTRSHPAMRFNYLSTETDRREWVEAIRVARDILNQPAFAPYNAGEISPGRRSRPTRRSSTGCAPTPRPRCTRPARRDGHRRPGGRRSRDDEGARRRGPARRRRLGVPVRHQRQHLRPGDDGRREGGRPDPRQHPLRPPTCPTTATATAPPLPPATAAIRRTDECPDRAADARPPAERDAALSVRTSGRSSAEGADDVIGRPTPTCPAPSSRRRPAAWSASRTCPSTSPPARCSS